MQHVEHAQTRFDRETAITPTTLTHIHIKTHAHNKKQHRLLRLVQHRHIFSFFLSLSKEIKSPRSELNELFIRVLCECLGACVSVSECMCLTLCVPAGKRRGHMLKMKMDIYHHRELREGKRRRRVVAGGNVTAQKEKMKNGGVGKGADEDGLGWREQEREMKSRKRLIASQELLHPQIEEKKTQKRDEE